MTPRLHSLKNAALAVMLGAALFATLFLAQLPVAHAQTPAPTALQAPAPASVPYRADYTLGAGDLIRLSVFQNPDLTLESRVSESGFITYPLIGAVELGGLSLSAAEAKVADALQRGGFLQKPQVTITLVQVRTNQVSVLGQVARPGRFPLDTANTRASDMLASAGGVLPGGDDLAILTGTRNGKPFRALIDIPGIFLGGAMADAPVASGNVAANSLASTTDTVLQGGDTLYVHRAPVYYIYGEAQRSGAYRIERDMTVMQAMALGGGPTNRGSENRLRLHRKGADGVLQKLDPQPSERILPNDVLYIKESIF